MAQPQLITLTDSAAQDIKGLMDTAPEGEKFAGLRVGVTATGCSGLSYTLEYADKKEPMDELVEQHGVTVLIDPKATLFILGTQMDYVEEKLQSGFVFRNPNEKGRCGCGESFHV